MAGDYPYNRAVTTTRANIFMSANFRSDNETPVAAAIWEALAEANQGTAYSYAEDRWSEQLDEVFSTLFEHDVRVLPVATGTVANSIALASVSPPWGSVFCHRNAHVYCDESGAPEFFGQGLRLVPVEGPEGKMQPEGLARAIHASEGHGVHSYAPAAFTLTQSTECGSVYTPGEVAALCTVARDKGLATHMDGARFGNAVAALGCSPAEITWKAGVDMLSFGASKNGCMAAEALVFFRHHDKLEVAERLRKRSGHLLSKMRYVSSQLLAYVHDGLWLDLAAHANRMAGEFAAAVEAHPEASLEYPAEANEVFVRWSAEGLDRLEERGIEFLLWPGHDDLARFVFGHSTTQKETHTLISALDG
jgi:threonine aldolase